MSSIVNLEKHHEKLGEVMEVYNSALEMAVEALCPRPLHPYENGDYNKVSTGC